MEIYDIAGTDLFAGPAPGSIAVMVFALAVGLALSLVLIGIVGIVRALFAEGMEYVDRMDEGPVYPLHNGPHDSDGET